MGHSRRRVEDSDAKSSIDYWVLAQEVSEGNNINSCDRAHSCGILPNNVVAFCSYPKNLPEAKLKRFGIMSLVKEIPRSPNISSLTWLLVITLMQIYYENQQAEKKRKQNVQFRDKEYTQNFNVGDLVCAERNGGKIESCALRMRFYSDNFIYLWK